MPSDARMRRARLSLEGLSLGDAFGETFFTDEPLARVHARRLRDGVWRWTDDTAMAVCVLETLVAHGGIDQDELARRFAARYVEEPQRGYGAGMRRLLPDIHSGRDWRPAARAQFGGRGSYGNGAAMRVPVAGAWFADDLDAAVAAARMSAEVTHTHAEAIAGAVAVAVAAALACRGADCPSGSGFVAAVLEHVPGGEVAGGLRRALSFGAGTPIDRVASQLGNGSEVSAQDTVPLVVWCAAHHLFDYEQALWLTVSALGDRDTTCAMVGAIVACATGRAGLPAAWLDRREPLPEHG